MNDTIIFCAQYLFVFVVLVAAAVWLRLPKDGKVRLAATIVTAGVVAFVLSRIAGKLYYDPRPFVSEHVKPLVAHAADNGFPSDHALFTAALTAAVYFFNKKAAAGMAVLTIAVGIARVLANVHSPLDIAAGWLFGALGAVVGFYVVVWALRRRGRARS